MLKRFSRRFNRRLSKQLTLVSSLLLLIASPSIAKSGKIDELEKLRVSTTFTLDKLKASGLGLSHPKIKQLEAALKKLSIEIENTKELHQEIVILLEGTKSHFLEGHVRHGKTDKAMTELLNAGWKIHKIISAGTTKDLPKNQEQANLLKAAYAWLTYEG